MRAAPHLGLLIGIAILAIGITLSIIGLVTEQESLLSTSPIDLFSMVGGNLQEIQLNYLIGETELKIGLPVSGLGTIITAWQSFFRNRQKI